MAEDQEKQPEQGDVCPKCGNREDFYIRNDSRSRDPLFSDLHCSRCGAFVRAWNSV